MSSTKRIGSKLAVAVLVAAVATTTGLVAYADDDKPETVEQEQVTDEETDQADLEDEGEVEAESAEGRPEDLPDKAVSDDVLAVIEERDSYENGREFGAAVSEAAQQNRQGEGAGAPESAGEQADEQGSDDADDARRDGDAPDGVRKDGEHRP